MNKNFLYNAILFICTIAAAAAVAYIASTNYVMEMGYILIWFLLGAVVAGLVNTILHEMGHLIGAKIKKFQFVSMTLWFVKIVKIDKKIRFLVSFKGNNKSYFDFVPIGSDNLKERYIFVARGGYICNLIMAILSIIPLIFVGKMDYSIYCFLGAFLPLSIYYFLINALPMTNEGAYNDATMIQDLKNDGDESKIILNLMQIYAKLSEGKTPSEIDFSLYNDIPQIEEDNLNYLAIMNAKLEYYFDLGDVTGANEIINWLKQIEELPKEFSQKLRCDELYLASALLKNESLADNLMEELEEYLNKETSVYSLRIKLSYLAYIVKDKEEALRFYDCIKEELKTLSVVGERRYEETLIERIYNDIKAI